MFRNLVINELKRPLLHFLVEYSNDEEFITQILLYALQQGFNANISNSNNETPLHINCMRKSSMCCKISQILMNFGANPCLLTNDKRMTPIHLLVMRRKQNCECIKILIKNNRAGQNPIESRTQENLTALHLAILNDQTELVKQLLDCGASPVAEGPNSYKPIHLACQWGSKGILSYIIISLLENISQFKLNEKT